MNRSLNINVIFGSFTLRMFEFVSAPSGKWRFISENQNSRQRRREARSRTIPEGLSLSFAVHPLDMPLRTSWQPKEEPAGGAGVSNQTSTARLQFGRSAKARGIEATARLLRPTSSSLARVTTKRLSGEEKAKAEARSVERKRRQMARVTKPNGRLTVPVSPKLRTRARSKSTTAATLLTMTSRELLEIAAIKKRVQETRKKVQQYHEATTRSVLSVASSATSSSSSSSKTSFAVVRRYRVFAYSDVRGSVIVR